MAHLINFNDACRLCLKENFRRPIDIWEESRDLCSLIRTITTLDLNIHERLPSKICPNCLHQLEGMLEFREKCIESDRVLRKQWEKMSMPIKHEDTLDGCDEEMTECRTNPLSDADFEDIADIHHTENVLISPSKESQRKEKKSKIKVHKVNRKTNDSGIIEQERSARTCLETGEDKSLKQAKYDYGVACELCGKKIRRQYLDFHMNVHKGLKPYVCEFDDCKKAFQSPHLLKRHQVVVHSDVKRFECGQCGKQFKLKCALKIHETYHGDPQIPCTICSKLVRNERALKKHMMIHTGERSHNCEICRKSFQTRYTLKVHKRIHTNEKPFICDLCDESFIVKCLLKSHMRRAHPQG